jgi:hypothetical protein
MIITAATRLLWLSLPPLPPWSRSLFTPPLNYYEKPPLLWFPKQFVKLFLVHSTPPESLSTYLASPFYRTRSDPRQFYITLECLELPVRFSRHGPVEFIAQGLGKDLRRDGRVCWCVLVFEW